MGSFQGGSAPAMARQIADGYTLVNAVSLKRYSSPELDQLTFEIDKKIRELRADQPAVADTQALQQYHRKIQRLESATRVIRGTMSQRRRRG